MKLPKIVCSILIIAFIMSFASCGDNPTPDETPLPTSGQAEESVREKLVVYTDMLQYAGIDKYASFLASMKSIMELQHNIEVEYYDPTGGDPTMDYAMAVEKMNLELMVGKGPDIIIGNPEMDDYYGVNLQKQMAAGAFAPLNEYLGQDADNYSFTILEACAAGDVLYLLPISYYMSVHFTTEEYAALNEINISAMDSIDRYIAEATRFMQGDVPRSLFGSGYDNASINALANLLKRAYPATQELKKALDTDMFVDIVELAKLEHEKNQNLYAPGEQVWHEDPEFGMILENYYELMLKALAEGKVLSSANFGASLGNLTNEFLELSLEGTCTFMPVPNVQGGNTAVICKYAAMRTTSDNKDAAWAFIQLYAERYNALAFTYALPATHFDVVSTIATPWYYAQRDYLGDILPQSVLDKLNPNATITPDSTSEQVDDTLEYPLDEWHETLCTFVDAYQNNITGAVLSTRGHEMVGAAFEDYIKGAATYEQCLANAKFQLELYLTE